MRISSTSPPSSSSRGSSDRLLEPEDALEERRRAVADGAARGGLAAGLCEKAPLDQAGDGGVGGDAADTRDLGPRARAEVRHDRQRLERGLR